MSKCEHMNFAAQADIHRLLREVGKGGQPGEVQGFMAKVRINCADCGRAFQFLGLEPGVDTQGARASVDGLEALLAICPQGEQPSFADRIAVNISMPTERLDS